ncbi:unnamed protein product [Blepharisma stoltei]|uniref:Uncharacterized protein n=1 Tax=Blepharisma stoltei TaxID=1481888 RepID=A0AAU9IIG8_9CILI|nr:unnamed protein product [Blepharisma stoltei]
MSDYEPDFDEIPSSRVSPKKKEQKVKADNNYLKPGSLPWDEESMTYSRDDGSTLIQLQRENVKLRDKLKNLSQRLNDLIEITQKNRAKKKVKKIDTSRGELETAMKKVEVYEKQWKKLSKRIEELKDPDYERNLKNEIENDEIHLQELENNVRKGEVSQRKRGKVLKGVLSTGETEDMYKMYNELVTESTVYIKKLKKIEERDAQIESSYNEITPKLNKLEREYDQLRDLETTKSDENASKVQEKIAQLEREQDIKIKEFNSKIRVLNGRIKDLEGEIKEIDNEESELYLEIERRNFKIKDAQASIGKLRESSEFQSEASKKSIKPPLFETEIPNGIYDKRSQIKQK